MQNEYSYIYMNCNTIHETNSTFTLHNNQMLKDYTCFIEYCCTLIQIQLIMSYLPLQQRQLHVEYQRYGSLKILLNYLVLILMMMMVMLQMMHLFLLLCIVLYHVCSCLFISDISLSFVAFVTRY